MTLFIFGLVYMHVQRFKRGDMYSSGGTCIYGDFNNVTCSSGVFISNQSCNHPIHMLKTSTDQLTKLFLSTLGQFVKVTFISGDITIQL